MFIILINEVGQYIKKAQYLLFADFKLFGCLTAKSNASDLQQILSTVLLWCNLNKINLNVNKCFLIRYTSMNNIILHR